MCYLHGKGVKAIFRDLFGCVGTFMFKVRLQSENSQSVPWEFENDDIF